MRSPFADTPDMTVPRTLSQLLAQDVPQETGRARKRRPRKVRTQRRNP